MRELHLFAGAGGGILGGLLLGHRPVGAVEINDYCQRILRQRQLDGMLPSDMEIHDDIKTFDGRPWRGRADIVAGGFPCQDISAAGKGAGLDGERSGLWWEMHRVVCEVEPKYVFVENTPTLLVRGFDRVLGSLADLGYDAEWCVLSAADCGAPHLRKRLWLLAAHPDRHPIRDAQQRAAARRDDIPPGGVAVPGNDGEAQLVADANSHRWHEGPDREPEQSGAPRPARLLPSQRARPDARQVADPESVGRSEGRARRTPAPSQGGGESAGPLVADPDSGRQQVERIPQPAGLPGALGDVADGCGENGQREYAPEEGGWWAAEPSVGRLANGVADRVAMLRCVGNGQVPVVAASAWRILMERLATK